MAKHECMNCSKVFQRRQKLENHKKKGCNGIVCDCCGKSFSRNRNLLRHKKNAVFINCPDCPRMFCNADDQQQHVRSNHTKITHDAEYSLDAPICPRTGYENDEGYLREKQAHLNKIRSRVLRRSRYSVINQELPPDYTYGDLRKTLYELSQTNSYKINIGTGLVLHNTFTGEYKYYYNSSNSLLFEKAYQISTRKDLNEFYQKIVDLDLVNNYYLKKPNSAWIVAGLPNMEILIYPLKGIPIGSGELPEYIKNSKAIISLTHDEQHGHAFNDNKRFWRCLAVHLGASLHALERKTEALLKEFQKHTGQSFEDGVEFNILPAIEVYFNIAINVYSLRDDGSADVLRLSKLDYDIIHLNIYEKHFSFINDFRKYAKKYTCENCGRVLNQSCHLQRHVKECSTETEEVYIGGKYRSKKNIFELLDQEGLEVLSAKSCRRSPTYLLRSIINEKSAENSLPLFKSVPY